MGTTASLKYAKPGCKDTCGNDVVISYPFGIGASCSINEWYTVYCNSSKPYLVALNHLQLVGVDLQNQTVNVNMPKFSDCSQVINSVDLDRSPFLYSKTHNKLIYEGYCGNAVMMDDDGSALTGCSTTCNNDTTNTTVIIDTNKCFGISCCQIRIPRYLKSYRMNLTGLESQLGRDGGCGSAFFVDKHLYDEGSFSRQSFGAEGRSSYVSTALLWTLSDRDKDQFTCCDAYGGRGFKPYSLKVDLGNGRSLDTWRCVYDEAGNPYVVDGCPVRVVPEYDEPLVPEECTRCSKRGGYCDYEPILDVDGLVYQDKYICYGERQISMGVILGTEYAKPGCKDTCGNDVVISYPFGIGANCSLNEWYTVYCKSSKPYLAALNHLQLVGVDLQSQTVTVNMPKFSNCSQVINSVDLGRSPFLYSKTHNKLIYEGHCGNAVMMDDDGSALTGCSTTCNNDTTNTTVIIDTNKCFGISCCQIRIPRYLKSYRMNLTGLESQLGRDGGCGSAFFVDKHLYDEGSFSRQSFGAEGRSSYVSTALLWTLSDRDKDQFTCCDAYGGRGFKPYSLKVDLGNGRSLDTWRCVYDEAGNPYVVDGCPVRVVPEYDEPLVPEECTSSEHIPWDDVIMCSNPKISSFPH
ncbi:wall-associated receptor kinase [Tanacetum coccineum]